MSRFLTLSLLCLLWAPSLRAVAEEPAPATATGVLTRRPELLQFVEAPYPPEAKDQKLTGTVEMTVDLDATGAVTKVVVTGPAGHGFDEAAIAAVQKFRFSPAEIDHLPTPVQIAYRYHFVLTPDAPAEPAPPPDKAVNFRGRLLTRGDRAPVVGAILEVGDTGLSTTTDKEGRFELRGVPAGLHRMSVSAPGYQEFTTQETVTDTSLLEVTYTIQRHLASPYETIVWARRERKAVTQRELQKEEIRLIPGTQGDAFKVVQNLPGVARLSYGLGGLVVRGGRPTDTRVYIDDVYIPALFHFGGLVSTFNSELLQDLSFYPGNFGAHLGRSIGGALEAQSRSPRDQGLHGYVNISMLDTSALLESPLGNDWTIAAAGRVSYVDLILGAVLPDSIRFLQAPRYYDYQLKLEHAPAGSPDKFRFLAFGSNDSMKLLMTNAAEVDPEGRDTLSTNMGYHRLMGSWEHHFSGETKNKLTLALGSDPTTFGFGTDVGAQVSAYSIQLRDVVGWRPSESLSFEFGTDTYLARVRSNGTFPIQDPREIPDPILSNSLQHFVWDWTLFQPGLFAEALWRPLPGMRVVPGLRFDYEAELKRTNLDPRISLFQALDADETSVLKGAIGLYEQPPDYSQGQWTATFGNPNLGLERSLHTMLGFEQRFSEAISLDVQVYYKAIYDQVRTSGRIVTRDGVQVPERYGNIGSGRSYGLEILLRHNLTHNFFGWLSYSLSRSEWKNPDANDPGWTRFPYDQPHHLVAVASYKWNPDWTTGLRFQYVSGSPYTPVIGTLYDADANGYVPVMGAPASRRMPAFVSLDLRVDRRFTFENWSMSLYLDVQNVTNSTNPEMRIYNYDYSKSAYLSGLPIFPSIGLKAEF